jgi:nitronate monooxygenase
MPHESSSSPLERAQRFADRLGIRLPILLGPMSGACPPSLSIAVINAGGLGACGALMMKPGEIITWSDEVRAKSGDRFQINLWIPDPPPVRNVDSENRQREFLASWGPPMPPEAGDIRLPDFEQQCQALLTIKPKAVSSVMGLYPPSFVAELKAREVLWIANVTTVAEARAAEAAGADIIAAQGMEAGGHRGAFQPEEAEHHASGLISLVPQIVDAVRIPVVAAGGIADARGVAAALILGASAVQIGTGFLRAPEAMTPPSYADRIAQTEAHQTMLTRSFSGRPGRSIATAFVRAAQSGPPPAPYPIQRGLTATMRETARKSDDVERMQAWAGQSAKLARAEPAATIVQHLWEGAVDLLKATR